eukprot:gene2961-3695_t
MSLIKSVAGVRGTLGGKVGEGLTPIDIVHITAAFGRQVILSTAKKLVVVGRDARPSGPMISQLVCATLQGLGIDVIDLGLSTTPTASLAVIRAQASGGIVITASHNPAGWNALKLFNAAGEYVDSEVANKIFELAASAQPVFVKENQLGSYVYQDDAISYHVEQILALPLVDVEAIRERKFKVAVDAVNSTGGLAVPALLQALQVAYKGMYCQPTGLFPHDPEPVTPHLTTLIGELRQGDYDLGIAVDPDVDRLVIMDEKGNPWGEEYSLVAAADYVLGHTPGNSVSNLSSSSALQVVTQQHGGSYAASPVGEVHVVEKMKATHAVVGGEGNGGIIYPPLHYGRDALVGIALILSHLAKTGKTASNLRQQYPNYELVKIKMQLSPDIHPIAILKCLQVQYGHCTMNTEEGLKVMVPGGWFHLRQSNTEPIIRLHVEGDGLEKARAISEEVIAAMLPYMEMHYGNPSSLHAYGRVAKVAVEKVRKQVAELLQVAPHEIFFTSGGTEGNNLALQGVIASKGIQHVITSPIEHLAVLEPLRQLAVEGRIMLHYVQLDERGGIVNTHLEALLKQYRPALVSLMHGHNEVGNLNDLEAIGTLCHQYEAVFHTDAVQTMGAYALNLSQLPVDMVVGSAHKFHGPKGGGILYIKETTAISPQLLGGAQERGMRAGTENVPAIVGLGQALEIAYNDRWLVQRTIEQLKKQLMEGLCAAIPGVQFSGHSADLTKSLYTLLSVQLPHVADQDMVLFNLDIHGIAASAGSACTSGSQKRSHVMEALYPGKNNMAIRFAFSKYNTADEVNYVIKKVQEIWDLHVRG